MNFNFKYFFVFFSYLTLLILIILSYIAIVPSENIPVLQNNKEIVKKIDNKFIEKENSVYEILKKKKEDDIQINQDSEDKIAEKIEEIDSSKKIYRLQFASFKEKKKSQEVAAKIQKFFLKKIDDELIIMKISLKNKGIFFRVVSKNLYEYDAALSSCELIKMKFSCLILKENK